MKKSLDKDYKNHGRALGWGSGPEADWKVMFSVFLIVIFLVAILNVLLYRSARGGYEAEEVSVELPINKEELRRTANFYTTKSQDFESVRKTPVTIPDPSI